MTDIEQELLLAVARVRPTAEETERVRELLRAHADTLDWGFLIDQAVRHKVLALLGRRVDEAMAGAGIKAKIPHRKFFRYYAEANRQRNEAMLAELARVMQAFSAAGVRAALRKGAVLARELYRDLSVRQLGDIDLLVGREDFDQAHQVLEALGYVDGDVDITGQVAVPNSREFRIFWALHGNGFHFVRTTDEPFVEAYPIELTDNLYAPDSGVSVPVSALVPHYVPDELHGVATDKLGPAAFLLDVCSDIYLKATTLYFIEQSKDLQLMKFIDLRGLVTETGTLEVARQLRELADGFGVLEQAAFSLYLAAELFGDEPFATFLDCLPAPAGGIRGFGAPDGVSGQWQVSVRDRIFDNRRAEKAPRSQVWRQ